MKTILVILMTGMFAFSVYARNFKTIKIPGAKCASGKDYRVWVHKKSNEKLAIEFMGGGACWSQETCFGRDLKTWIFPIPKFPIPSTFSIASKVFSPVHDHSYIFFPYCTGDVHSGNHTAQYGKKTIYHWGKKNVNLALNYLKDQGIIDFSALEEVVLYGASAGAIGAIANINEVDALIPNHIRRKAIADSPGMHFGDTFWDKFPEQYFQDLKNAFAPYLEVQRGDGFIAKKLTGLCHTLFNWDIGVIQANKDFVMSQVFGDISPEEHKERVMHPEGLLSLNNRTNNCFASIIDGKWHTMYIAQPTTKLKDILTSQSVRDFAFEIQRK